MSRLSSFVPVLMTSTMLFSTVGMGSDPVRAGLQASVMVGLGVGPSFVFMNSVAGGGAGVLLQRRKVSVAAFAEYRKRYSDLVTIGFGGDYSHSAYRRNASVARRNYFTLGPRVAFEYALLDDIMLSFWVNPYLYSSAEGSPHSQFFHSGGLSLTFFYH